MASGVLHFILPRDDNSKWVVAAGLAQMSEFAFLLASRARRFGLIGREVGTFVLFLVFKESLKNLFEYIDVGE